MKVSHYVSSFCVLLVACGASPTPAPVVPVCHTQCNSGYGPACRAVVRAGRSKRQSVTNSAPAGAAPASSNAMDKSATATAATGSASATASASGSGKATQRLDHVDARRGRQERGRVS